ncbi:hypothetical protein ZIOFF_035649 [Zingiber officinale]|uniref:Uncharacterized protein n=1 Tax=Zingiber officinale TaxID=94328 RepID=A0A8J5GKT2_ZINOF|nr:hypothetical protein ZIOFF_035649 [Zingiber officinale]
MRRRKMATMEMRPTSRMAEAEGIIRRPSRSSSRGNTWSTGSGTAPSPASGVMCRCRGGTRYRFHGPRAKHGEIDSWTEPVTTLRRIWDRNAISMSFAPKDEHEAQIQFALERDGKPLLKLNRILRVEDSLFGPNTCSTPVYRNNENAHKLVVRNNSMQLILVIEID